MLIIANNNPQATSQIKLDLRLKEIDKAKPAIKNIDRRRNGTSVLK